MHRIKEVLRLTAAGLSQRQIARSLHLSHGVVAKYQVAAQRAGLSWPLADELEDEDLLTDKQIRRGIFQSVPDLITAINSFVKATNDDPVPFVWTASVEAIMQKINRCKAIYETQH